MLFLRILQRLKLSRGKKRNVITSTLVKKFTRKVHDEKLKLSNRRCVLDYFLP